MPPTSSSSFLLSSLELIDTTVYEPQIRALLGFDPHFCKSFALNLRTVPLGTALSLKILRVSYRGAQTEFERGDLLHR